MRRRSNMQHGQARRMPRPVRAVIFILAALTGLLIAEIVFFFGGA